MRCPDCGARNVEGAAWCSQCYRSFTPGASDEPATGGQDASVTPPPEGAPGTAAGSEPDRGWLDTSSTAGEPEGPTDESVGSREPPVGAGVTAATRDVRERDGVVEWRCAACDGWNELTTVACSVCASPRRGFGTEREEVSAREVDPSTVLAASILLPGLGHLLAGRTGTGIARIVLMLLWVAGGVALLAGSGGGTLIGVVLLVGALLLWAGTLVDARNLGRSSAPELLRPRALGLLVGAVTLLMVVAAFAAAPTPAG
jgi:hypothetical protein